MEDLDSAIKVWQAYTDTIVNWETLITGITPKSNGCGSIYELTNPIDRPNESFAIADMRKIKITEPHYHPNNETEIYIVLQGLGLTVVGGKEVQIKKGSVIVTPPDTAHFTIPANDLVLAVINIPSFKPENYVVITETNNKVGFDQEQFARLSASQIEHAEES